MSCSKLSNKRKIENGISCFFYKQWTERYFLTDVGVKAVCLICHETVAVFKEYNLKWHFQTKHANFRHNLSKQKLQNKAIDLIKCL